MLNVSAVPSEWNMKYFFAILLMMQQLRFYSRELSYPTKTKHIKCLNIRVVWYLGLPDEQTKSGWVTKAMEVQ